MRLAPTLKCADPRENKEVYATLTSNYRKKDTFSAIDLSQNWN